MGSPFYHPTKFTPAASSGAGGAGPASGSKELSYSGLTAGAESGIGAGGEASLSNQQVAQAAAAKASAEAVALAKGGSLGQAALGHAALGNAAVGHAAIGSAAIGNAAIAPLVPGAEQVSPLVQLIMRLPGALGVTSSFFEWIMHLFAPGGHDLFSALDPTALHLDLADHVAGHLDALGQAHALLEAGEHFTVNLASLPADAPIMHSLAQIGASAGSNPLASPAALSDHFTVNPANLGASLDPAKAQFEQMPSSSGAGLSGPSLSGSSGGTFLEGNQRLFSDKVGGSQFNTITSNTSVPANQPAVSTGTVSTPAGSQSLEPAVSQPGFGSQINHNAALDGTSPQQVDNLARPDNSAYTAGTGDYTGGSHLQSQAASGDIKPLTAKPLSFADLHKHAFSAHTKHLLEHISSKPAGNLIHPSASARVLEGIGHRNLPQAGSTAANKLPDGAHKTVAKSMTAHKASGQGQTAPKQPASNDTLAKASEGKVDSAQATEQAGAYTVHKGDSLWNIADKQLGDGTRWSEIYRLNTESLGSNPNLIFSGTQLKLPGAQNMVADASKYVVKSGDNLWNIAKGNLGDATKWSEIYKANAGVIGSNPSFIMPGQQLSLPGSNAAIAQLPTTSMPPISQAMPQGSSFSDMTQAAAPSTPASAAFGQPQSMSAQAAGGSEAAAALPATAGSESAGAAQAAAVTSPASSPAPLGPDAAGAATLNQAPRPLVSASLAPDLSFLRKKPGI